MFITNTYSSQLHTVAEHWLLLMQMKSERTQAATSESIHHCAKHAALYFSICYLRYSWKV